MKFKDLLGPTSGGYTFRIKDEYFHPKGGVDFSKVPEPIEDIDRCDFGIYDFSFYGEDEAPEITIKNTDSHMQFVIRNYENHKEIVDKVLKKYFRLYKELDAQYKALSDEEKLKLELGEN